MCYQSLKVLEHFNCAFYERLLSFYALSPLGKCTNHHLFPYGRLSRFIMLPGATETGQEQKTVIKTLQ